MAGLRVWHQRLYVLQCFQYFDLAFLGELIPINFTLGSEVDGLRYSGEEEVRIARVHELDLPELETFK